LIDVDFRVNMRLTVITRGTWVIAVVVDGRGRCPVKTGE